MVAKTKNLVLVAKQQAKRYFLRPVRRFVRIRLIKPVKIGLAVLYRRCGLKVPGALRKTYVDAVYTDAWRHYAFKPYDGDVVIFYSSRTPGDKRSWEGVTSGELTVECFEAGHLEFYQNSELMNRWTTRLAHLLMSHQVTADTGGSEGAAR